MVCVSMMIPRARTPALRARKLDDRTYRCEYIPTRRCAKSEARMEERLLFACGRILRPRKLMMINPRVKRMALHAREYIMILCARLKLKAPRVNVHTINEITQI